MNTTIKPRDNTSNIFVAPVKQITFCIKDDQLNDMKNIDLNIILPFGSYIPVSPNLFIKYAIVKSYVTENEMDLLFSREGVVKPMVYGTDHPYPYFSNSEEMIATEPDEDDCICDQNVTDNNCIYTFPIICDLEVDKFYNQIGDMNRINIVIDIKSVNKSDIIDDMMGEEDGPIEYEKIYLSINKQ